MQTKLPCYALTPAALRILAGSPHLQKVPDEWFGWAGAKGRHDFSTLRVTLQQDPSDLRKWNENAVTAGYLPIILFAERDVEWVDACDGLDPSTELMPVPAGAARDRDRRHLLSLVREPEAGVTAAWIDTMMTGIGGNTGFDLATADQWLAYGVGLGEWIDKTAANDSDVRLDTPDFTRWEIGPGVPAEPLSRATWDFDAPLLRRDHPDMPGAFIAYWPTRQLPGAGVALELSGELVCIGALPHNWSWDPKGIAKAAFRRAAQALRTPEPLSPSGRSTRALLGHGIARSLFQHARARSDSRIEKGVASAPSWIRWSEESAENFLEVSLSATDSEVRLAIESVKGGRPVVLRLLADNRQWPVAGSGDAWRVEGLAQGDVDQVINLFCAGADGADAFARDGYSLTWESDDD